MCDYCHRDHFIDTSRFVGWGPAPEIGPCDYPDFCPGIYGPGCNVQPRLIARLTAQRAARPWWKRALAEIRCIADNVICDGQESIL